MNIVISNVKKSMPLKISIVMAVFNNQEFVADAINSILCQTYKNVEFIVIDGESTDNTLQVINEFKQSIDLIISEPDKGIYDALNKGINAATGDVIGFLHSDDVFADCNVLDRVAQMFNATGCDGLYSDLEYVSKSDKNNVLRFWKSCDFQPSLLQKGWMPPHPTLFLRKAVYKDVGLFSLNYQIASDYEFILRLFQNRKYHICYMPKTNVKMRLGGKSNKKISNLLLKSKEDLAIMNNYGLNGWTLLMKNISKFRQFIERSSM